MAVAATPRQREHPLGGTACQTGAEARWASQREAEADDLQRICQASGCGLEELRRAAAAADFETSEPWTW